MSRNMLTVPKELPSGPEACSLLGVEYLRLRTQDGGEIYLTSFGIPFNELLAPQNWHEPAWFHEKRVRLNGTSAIYRVPTKRVRGISLDLVVRHSRVGQEVPLDPRLFGENPHAEFNSPFEEFAILLQLRAAHSWPDHPRIFTKKPLAIYVPALEFQDWQIGRSESRMAAKASRHPEARLDMRRDYLMVYGWIDGLNAVQAAQAAGFSAVAARQFLESTTLRVIDDLKRLKFRMLDMKPEHIVLRMRRDGSLLRRGNGSLAYALVDYELLEPLPGHG